MNRENLTLDIEVLTGIHIGTGEEITPFDYYMDRESDGAARMVRFRLEDIVAHLSPKGRAQFSQIIDGGNLPQIHQEIKKHATKLPQYLAKKGSRKSIARYTALVSGAIYGSYQDNLDHTRNQLIIQTTIRNAATQRPMIPGSSLKGALRTAWLSRCAARSGVFESSDRWNDRYLEQEILGYKDAKSDPFRALSIADSDLKSERGGKYDTMVCEARLWSAKKGQTGSPQMWGEFVRGDYLDGDAGGSVQMVMDNTAIHARIPDWEPPHSVLPDLLSLLRVAGGFYRSLLDQEVERVFGSGGEEIKPYLRGLQQVIDESDPRWEFPVKIGRYSQKEYMTLTPDAEAREWGHSRTLMKYQDALIPAGWIILSVPKSTRVAVEDRADDGT